MIDLVFVYNSLWSNSKSTLIFAGEYYYKIKGSLIMRTLFFILFFVLGFCYIQARGQKPAHVIITAGQSNTDGRVPNNRLPDYIKAMAVDSTYTAGAYKY